MKEQFIFFSVYVIFIVFHGTEALWIRRKNHERTSMNDRWTRRNLETKAKGSKRVKLNVSVGKDDASQKKRQFVPDMPFLNFPHPHIHRIIVHRHPGRS